MIDFHSHLMPGVDDGAVDLEQSRAAIHTMREQGVTAAVTTPHLSGSLLSRPEPLAMALAEMDAAWDALRGMVEAEFHGFRLERGAEVALDSPAPDLSDPRVRLAGTSYVLVEFPYMNIPPASASAIFELRLKGWTPVIAHPERYSGVSTDRGVVDEWIRVGGLLQVNSGSLIGRYGAKAEQIAWSLLERGQVSYLSSDFHGRGRCPVGEVREVLRLMGAGEQAALLTERNPGLLLADSPPEVVPPVVRRPKSMFERLGLRRRG